MNRLWEKLVRFGFRLLYNELAWTYDVVSWLVSFGEWRAWQRTALGFVEGRRVLEIAHGPGHLLRELHETGYKVVGMDVSAAMGRLAQGKGITDLARGEAQVLPFADGVFDCVLTTFPTEFFMQAETLTSVARVLGENGRFLIVPMGYFSGQSILHRFVDWLFAITGQSRPRADAQTDTSGQEIFAIFAQRAQSAGFQINIEQVATNRGGATVIIAQKNV